MTGPRDEQLSPVFSVRVQLCGKGTDPNSQQMKLGKKEVQVSRPTLKTGQCVRVCVGGWSEVGKKEAGVTEKNTSETTV